LRRIRVWSWTRLLAVSSGARSAVSWNSQNYLIGVDLVAFSS